MLRETERGFPTIRRFPLSVYSAEPRSPISEQLLVPAPGRLNLLISVFALNLLLAIWWGPVCMVMHVIIIPLRFCMQQLMLLSKDQFPSARSGNVITKNGHPPVLCTWQAPAKMLGNQELLWLYS